MSILPRLDIVLLDRANHTAEAAEPYPECFSHYYTPRPSPVNRFVPHLGDTALSGSVTFAAAETLWGARRCTAGRGRRGTDLGDLLTYVRASCAFCSPEQGARGPTSFLGHSRTSRRSALVIGRGLCKAQPHVSRSMRSRTTEGSVIRRTFRCGNRNTSRREHRETGALHWGNAGSVRTGEERISIRS